MRIMTLAEVCEINPRKAINLPAESEISFIPMEAVSVYGEIDTSRSIPVEKVKNYTVFCEGDILFAKITPCMENGKGAIAVDLKNGYGAGSTEFIVLRPDTGIVLPQWVYLFLSQKSFRLNCQQNMTGSAGQKRVPAKYLAECKIPVPSITEQERILSRIEELFSQLDKGVETLQKTKQQLSVYRQAVYASVFSQEHLYPITDFFDISGGLTKNSKRNEMAIKMPYLRVANVYYNKLDLNEIKEIGVTASEIDKTLLKKDDLLFVEGNGSKDQIGRVAIWDGSIQNCLHQNHLIKGRPLGNMLSEYALYYLISCYGRKQILDVASSTSGLYTLSTNKVKNLRVPYVGVAEQKQCIDKIEERITVCDSIEKTIDAALQQAEAMRQSILKHAFEGRLNR